MIDAMQPAKGVRRYRRDDASKYLLDVWGLSFTKKTLDKMASAGGGPAMEYNGRYPLYTEAALDAFARERLAPQVRNTTERQLQKAA